MKVVPYTLYGQSYTVLRRLRDNEPINFYYNYFDDDTSENAAFKTKELYAWSNKLVGANFYKVMLAAYALEGLYYSGINVVDDNADFISGDYYVAWINSLFDENFVSRSADPWDVYLALKGTKYEKYMTPNKFRDYKRTVIGYLGYMDVMAVTEGLTVLKEFLMEKEIGLKAMTALSSASGVESYINRSLKVWKNFPEAVLGAKMNS